MMAQNCLIPNGPPRLDTVNVPPCHDDEASFHMPNPSDHLPTTRDVNESCYSSLTRRILKFNPELYLE